jgi:tRNA (cytidine/uridine-2'-O-)-methyltransferase
MMDGVNIVLVEPEIPQNTGNIARTCAAAGARLHLIRPLGFILSDRKLRRAGADYWGEVDLVVHDDLESFFGKTPADQCLFFSVKGQRPYTQIPAENGGYFVFGRESVGLPSGLLAAHPGRIFRVPIRPETRSLNLSNAVAVVLFEALRLRGFPGLI